MSEPRWVHEWTARYNRKQFAQKPTDTPRPHRHTAPSWSDMCVCRESSCRNGEAEFDFTTRVGEILILFSSPNELNLETSTLQMTG